jgi:putative ABC transport system ATP-binding protein
MNPVIKISNLTYKTLLSYPDMSIPLGTVSFISGESGSGKSTLLKLLNGTLSPTSGTIEYIGLHGDKQDSISLRQQVLLASQDVYLFDASIKENFMEYYRYRELPFITETQMRDYLSVCCADFLLDANCGTLSGGERQRVFIAICLSFLPKVLMLDEPTSALDEVTSLRFFTQLIAFCKEKNITLLVISHNPRLVSQFAEQSIFLEKKAAP